MARLTPEQWKKIFPKIDSLSKKDQKIVKSARTPFRQKMELLEQWKKAGKSPEQIANLQKQVDRQRESFTKTLDKYKKIAAQVPVVPLPRPDSPRTNGNGKAKSKIGVARVDPNLKVIKKQSERVTKEESPQEFVKSILKGLERPPIKKKKVDTPASQKRKAKEATFRRKLKARELADKERREAAKRSSDRSAKFAQKIKERKPEDLGESAVSEYMRVSEELRANAKAKKARKAKKAVTTKVPESRSGLAQFWEDVKDLPKYLGTDLLPESHREDVVKGFKKFGKDITDLPSNLAKDFLPKQVKGSKKEGYTQDRKDMGPGLRKYKWDAPFFGEVEFDLDSRDLPKKKGGRIKKGVKKTKTKARKRAALRGHRAELRGG